jgi:hypothetical protein
MKNTSNLLLGLALLAAFGCKPSTPAQPMEDAAPPASPPYFLHLSDIHLDHDATCTSSNGDTGGDLWKITYQKLDSLLGVSPAPGFVLYTGDLPVHENSPGACDQKCMGDPTCRNASIQQVLHDLDSLVKGRNIPLFYLPGNNDGLGGDYTSFAELESGKLVTALSLVPQDPFPAINASTPCGSAPCALSMEHLNDGYYSARPMSGLRLIALNSVILGKKYTSEDGVSQDAAGDTQIAWMEQQLQAAQQSSEKVYVAMHIPPGRDYFDGKPYWLDPAGAKADTLWQNEFLNLLKTYSATVAGVFYGHSHMDEFKMIMDPTDTSQVMELAISCPGITPRNGNNPGFKLVYYDPASMEVTDFVTHYTTLPVQSTFGGGSYRFSTYLSCQGQGSLLSCMSGMGESQLIGALSQIYGVKAPGQTVNHSSGLYVRPQVAK